MTPDSTIPPGFQELFDKAGPVIRYRLLRDVIGEDDSFIRTAHLGIELKKLPEIVQLLDSQKSDGTWGRLDTTVWNYMRLCELGFEASESIESCIEQALLPNLARSDARDEVLQLLTRSHHDQNVLSRAAIEQIIAEWKLFLAADKSDPTELMLPTFPAYAALCHYPWSIEERPGIQQMVMQLFEHAEANIEQTHPDYSFGLRDKIEYLSAPQRMLYELELSARLGVTKKVTATKWMLEELEAVQDADGWFRFKAESEPELSWYFPIEPQSSPEVEFTFRAALIFKLLEYDL